VTHAANDDGLRAAARGRRDDAELAAALGVSIAVVARAEPAPPRRGPFVRAAIVLLGVLVTVAVALYRRADDVVLQEPASYEPPVDSMPLVEDAAKLASWSPTQRAFYILVKPDAGLARDLSPLARFPGLRTLLLMGPADWHEGVLAQLAALPRLEVLTIALGANCPPARLRELREVPSLRYLTLFLARALGPDDVQALAELPALTVLRLNNGALDAATVRALSTLPKLDALTLYAVDGCREDVLVELRTLHRLRQLELQVMGTPRWPGAGDDRGTVGLTPRVAEALQALPLLESLLLRNTAVSVAAIEALPKQLRRIGIRSVHADAEVFAALRRFPELRWLDLAGGGRDTLWRGRSGDAAIEAWIERELRDAPPREAVWAAQAALLRETPARGLRYYGAVPAPVREALRGAPLTSLLLERAVRDVGVDIDVAAALPELQQLTLDSCGATLEQLRPLAALAKLRQLTLLGTTGAELADVRALLPKVTVATDGM
jgi:hypothetical protein